MFRRKFTRRPFTRRRFGGARLRRPTTAGRWERSTFFVGNSSFLPAGSLSSQLVLFHLASQGMSLTQNSPVPTGVALSSMVRRLEIGGITYDWGIDWVPDSLTLQSDANPTDSTAWFMHALVTDKLVTESGVSIIPNSILAWEPFEPEFPTSVLTVSTPALQFDAEQPTRIHFQKTVSFNLGTPELVLSEDLQVPWGQPVDSRRHATVNRRLRLSLDDDQGLFLAFASRNCDGFDASIVTGTRRFRTWARGTLYHRWKF